MKSSIPGWLIACVALCGSGAVARAADESSELQLQARHVAVTICAQCHGRQGRSIAPKFPALAAQNANYLTAQLKAFKAQTRGDPDALAYMWGMSSPLTEDLITALADYYSHQAPASGQAGDRTLIAEGANIFANGVPAENIPACATCHGKDAAGTADYPRLAGQHSQYLLKQLGSFRSNLRDMPVMHGVTQTLKDRELQAVAAYLQSL